jgi:hypothetical protein
MKHKIVRANIKNVYMTISEFPNNGANNQWSEEDWEKRLKIP